MARVKGGPASHARHRKIIKSAKGYWGRRKILLGLLIKLLKKLVSMLIGTEKQEKEALGPYGFKELMLLQDLTALHMDNS